MACRPEFADLHPKPSFVHKALDSVRTRGPWVTSQETAGPWGTCWGVFRSLFHWHPDFLGRDQGRQHWGAQTPPRVMEASRAVLTLGFTHSHAALSRASGPPGTCKSWAPNLDLRKGSGLRRSVGLRGQGFEVSSRRRPGWAILSSPSWYKQRLRGHVGGLLKCPPPAA